MQAAIIGCSNIFGRMTIAVFAYLPVTAQTSHTERLSDLLATIAKAQPQSRIILYTTPPHIRLSQDIKLVSGKPLSLPFGRRLLLHRWKRKAAEEKADIILYFGLRSFISTKNYSLLFIREGEANSRALIRHKTILQKAAKLLVTTSSDKEAVAKYCGRKESDIVVLPGIAEKFLPAPDAQSIKDNLTGGCEYFLYYGPFSNHALMIRLLKAFSRFKHRQKSSWKLVLMQGLAPSSPLLQQDLKNYKYRSDIVMLTEEADAQAAAVLQAAYAFVYPELPLHYGRYLLAALAAGLPIIATTESREWLQEAALYVPSENDDDLAAALMQLYKDEALHGRLAAVSKEQSRAFLPQRAVAAWNEAVIGAVK